MSYIKNGEIVLEKGDLKSPKPDFLKSTNAFFDWITKPTKEEKLTSEHLDQCSGCSLCEE